MAQEVQTQTPQGGAGTGVAVFDYGEFAGAGFENAKASDFKPSFLRVLQPGSPELETVKGAKAGLILDNVTNDLYEAINVVVGVREHVFCAWLPRKEGGGGGGGFGGVFQLDDPAIQPALGTVKKFERGEDGKLVLPEFDIGDKTFQLVETVYNHCAQIAPNGAVFPVTIPFYSTGLPVAGDWYSIQRRQMIPGTNKEMPLFAHVFKLSTIKVEKNGNRWYNFQPSWAYDTAEASRLSPDSEFFKAGASIWQAFKKGTADVNYAAGGAGNAPTGGGKKNADDVPF